MSAGDPGAHIAEFADCVQAFHERFGITGAASRDDLLARILIQDEEVRELHDAIVGESDERVASEAVDVLIWSSRQKSCHRDGAAARPGPRRRGDPRGHREERRQDLGHPSHQRRGQDSQALTAYSSRTMCTSPGPWTPVTRVWAMSAVRLGPVMMLR